jgi:CO/xanthine dehydrogenase Mo-binding subunit
MEEPCFLTDIYLPQMLYAVTIRSPIAKGLLKSIECPKIPGSYTLIRAGDIPGKNFLDDSGLPILAENQLSYIGEPVALLLGPIKDTLEEYLQQCKVIVEEEKPVFSAVEVQADMVVARPDICVGDPETAFAQAATIIRSDYYSGIQEHWYAEPVGAVSWIEQTPKTVVVRTATQWPSHVKRSVAHVLGLSAVQVKPTLSTLHMDGKLWYPSLVSCHAALGALLTDKPVRLTQTKKEDFSFSPKRFGAEMTIASSHDSTGAVTGIDINTIVNLGAYAVNTNEILGHINLGSMGIYKIKNIRCSGAAVRTNIPPQGPFAGFGLAQVSFALERHISRIADRFNQDPAQWRKDNFSKTGSSSPGLPVKDIVPVEQLTNTAMKISDYSRKWAAYEVIRQTRKERLNSGLPTDSQTAAAPRRESWAEKGESLRGIGIAVGCQVNDLLYIGPAKGAVELTLERDGSLEIRTSIANSGADCSNMMTIASEILGVDIGMIRINTDSDCPDSGPSTVSRAAAVVTKLVEQACISILKKRFRDPLPISVRKTIRPQKNPPWESRASAVVEIEINPIEFLPQIRGVWMSIDGGKIISEDRARRSLKISAVQALGWAYREQICYVAGAIPTDQFENFDIPSPHEIPPISIEFITNNSGGPKGIGDLPFSCIPAAYLQAVSQAMDYHFDSIPLKALDIWYAGKNKKGNTA